MYKSVTVLNANEHKDFRFTPISDLLFAKDMNLIPISFSEVNKLCCDYPIVFIGGESPYLAIVVGIDEKGKNLAIDESGKWRGEYVPAFLRRYPFVLVKADENNLVLGFDIQSGCFSDPSGKAMFTKSGKPSKFVKDHMTFLENFEREYNITCAMAKFLDQKGLLNDSAVTISKNEESKNIGGFKVVDSEKLAELDDKTLAQWVKDGWIELLSLHKLSLKNFNKIVSLANID